MGKPQRSDLDCLIRQEVRAQMKRYVMARTREEFINHLTDVLSPALSHHYRVVLSTLNQRTDQTEKWQQQLDGFLRQFTERLIKPVKSRRLDRKKAVEQALKEVLQTDGPRRRAEAMDFQRTYTLTPLIPLPDNAHEDFFARVREIVQTLFPS